MESAVLFVVFGFDRQQIVGQIVEQRQTILFYTLYGILCTYWSSATRH